MVKQIEDDIDYYYDSHPIEEEFVGQTAFHGDLIRYLVLVLQWMFRDQLCAVYDSINFYKKRSRFERPISPDIAVIKGVPQQKVTSWKIWKTGIVPQVVFEFLSKETWERDLEEKPQVYSELGIDEYFAYDPHDPPVVRKGLPRLFGWKLDRTQGIMVPLIPDAEGRLWSDQLESWLVPDEDFLRLYDRENRLRLTRDEALAEKLRSLGINPDEI